MTSQAGYLLIGLTKCVECQRCGGNQAGYVSFPVDRKKDRKKKVLSGNFLMVQWLKHAANVGGMGYSIPDGWN